MHLIEVFSNAQHCKLLKNDYSLLLFRFVCKLHPLGDCGITVNATRALVMHTACFVMFIYRSYVTYVDCGTAVAASVERPSMARVF